MRVAVFVTCEGASVRNKDRERDRGAENVSGGEERSTLMDMQFTPLPLRASESEDVELWEC